MSGAALSVLFKIEAVVPVFGGRSLKTIILMTNHIPVMTDRASRTMKVFFEGESVKKKTVMGIANKKVTPVSFDINERKKQMLPRMNDAFDFVDMYFSTNHSADNPNKKHNSSSILLMLLTTSV